MGELEIAIPSNILEDCQSLSAKSQKLSLIARSASIFQINKIYIYKVKRRDDSRFISLLLNYLVTPQYLRKKLFPISLNITFGLIIIYFLLLPINIFSDSSLVLP